MSAGQSDSQPLDSEHLHSRTQPPAPSKLRPRGLAAHFDSYDQQKETSYLGMWVFLAQEVMFFGGLFTAYIVYRTAHPFAFALGSRTLDVKLGAINTAVLIGSSLTMALAVWAAQTGRRKAIGRKSHGAGDGDRTRDQQLGRL